MAEFVAQILMGTTPAIGDEHVAMELGSCAGFIDGLATAHRLSVQLMLDFASEVDEPLPPQGVDFSLRVIRGGAAESDG